MTYFQKAFAVLVGLLLMSSFAFAGDINLDKTSLKPAPTKMGTAKSSSLSGSAKLKKGAGTVISGPSTVSAGAQKNSASSQRQTEKSGFGAALTKSK